MGSSRDATVYNLVGKRLGRYLVISRIGKGGMGVVYEAFDPELQLKIALKILLPELARDEAFVLRFNREAITAAGLKHANIVGIRDVGELDGLHYIVEYSEGLAHYL